MTEPRLLAGLFATDSGTEGSRGPPVVLLHGSGATHRRWPQRLCTLPWRRVLALDLPGHGASPGPAERTVEALADRVLAFLDAAGLPRAVLVGHSLGGAVALATALKRPERVAALGLVATGAKLRVHPALLEGSRDPAGLAGAAELLADLCCGPQAPEALRQDLVAEVAGAAPGVLHADLQACDGFDVMDALAELRTPALVVCGTRDQLTPPRYAAFLRDCLPGSHLELVADAGHQVMEEAPEQVAEALEAFLANLPPPAVT